VVVQCLDLGLKGDVSNTNAIAGGTKEERKAVAGMMEAQANTERGKQNEGHRVSRRINQKAQPGNGKLEKGSIYP
jgi:hypothetical protein